MHYLEDMLKHLDYFSRLRRIELHLRTDRGDSSGTYVFKEYPAINRLKDAGISIIFMV
jgi:hypothetical protein